MPSSRTPRRHACPGRGRARERFQAVCGVFADARSFSSGYRTVERSHQSARGVSSHVAQLARPASRPSSRETGPIRASSPGARSETPRDPLARPDTTGAAAAAARSACQVCLVGGPMIARTRRSHSWGCGPGAPSTRSSGRSSRAASVRLGGSRAAGRCPRRTGELQSLEAFLALASTECGYVDCPASAASSGRSSIAALRLPVNRSGVRRRRGSSVGSCSRKQEYRHGLLSEDLVCAAGTARSAQGESRRTVQNRNSSFHSPPIVRCLRQFSLRGPRAPRADPREPDRLAVGKDRRSSHPNASRAARPGEALAYGPARLPAESPAPRPRAP